MAYSKPSKPAANAESNQRTTTALMVRINEAGIVVPAQVNTNLAGIGFDPDKAKQAIIMAVSMGIAPEALAKVDNVKALYQGWRFMTEFGMEPGVHFYAVPFKSDEDRVYAMVPSVNYLQTAVEEYSRLVGIHYVLEKRPIMGHDKTDEMLEFYAPPGYVKSKNNRVFMARFVPYVNGKCTIGPDDNWEVGYYLHDGVQTTGSNGSYKTAVDSKNLSQRNANRTGVDVASTRAIRKAARGVTRRMFVLSKATADDHIELMLTVAREKFIDVGPQRLLESPAGAKDAVANETDIADGVIDVELPPEPPPTVTVTRVTRQVANENADQAPWDEDESEGTGVEGTGVEGTEVRGVEGLVMALWAGIPDQYKAWQSELEAANHADGAQLVDDKGFAASQGWIARIANWSTGDELEGGYKLTDIVLAVLLGGKEIGERPSKDAMKLLYGTTGRQNGKGWEPDKNLPGYAAVVGIAAQIAATAEAEGTF